MRACTSDDYSHSVVVSTYSATGALIRVLVHAKFIFCLTLRLPLPPPNLLESNQQLIYSTGYEGVRRAIEAGRERPNMCLACAMQIYEVTAVVLCNDIFDVPHIRIGEASQREDAEP